MKTKKDLIFESISLMDIEMLELLLDDDRTYSDASKEVFLEKLADCFKDFKKSSDSVLVVKKGKCSSFECGNNKRRGFSFIGNVSKKHLDLIFEEDEFDILDMCRCRFFHVLYNRNINGKSMSLDIAADEKKNFVPSPEYIWDRKACEAALKEIMPDGEACIEKEDYKKWVVKHKKLYHNLFEEHYKYRRFCDFKELYENLCDLCDNVSYDFKAKKAMNDFGVKENEKFNDYLNWMVKYEKLAMTCFSLKGFPFNDKWKENNEIVKISDNFNLYINSKDFVNLKAFYDFMKKAYWEVFECYRTLSDQECVEHEEAYGHLGQVYLLSYHLKIRGLM